MTSSTTRAFMAKKQSTSFAQVATNLLNVLQGYTKTIRLLLVMFLTLTVSTNAWGAEDEIDHEATQSDLNSTATNTWKDFNLTGASGATYIIHSLGTKNTSNALQWNDNGYLYQEKSGGKLKSVTIKGTSGKSVKIYASTTAYTAKASGTAITTLNLTGSDAIYTFAANTNYTYLAINGNASATAITHIIVTYETAAATKLATPTNLKVSNVTTTSATLSWDAVTNASGYTVTVGSTPYSANTNSISLNSLTPSTTYKWSVVAKGNGSTYTDSESAKGSDFTTDTPQKYTVTWMVDKETLSTEDVYEDGKVSSVPTVNELPCGDKFVGWTDTPIQTPQNGAPDVFTTVDGSPTITKATTFYAVFADYEQ